MEKDHQQTTFFPSTSTEGDIINVDNEDVVPAVAAFSTSTIEGEEGAAASSKEDKKVVFASAEQIRAVFSNNNLVSHEIMSYWNIADMKAARQVSHTFLEMVETSKRFKDAQILHLVKGKSTVDEFNLLLNSGRIPRRIRIDVSLFTENDLLLNDNFRHILKNVQFVSLFTTCDLISLNDLDANELESISSFIRDVLRLTRNLQHLQIVVRLLEINLKSVFECSDVKENLKSLRRLDITDNTKRSDGQFYDEGCPLSLPELDTDVYPFHSLADNFLILGTIVHQLESFRMLFIFYEVLASTLRSAALGILQHNRETLKELCFDVYTWEDGDDITGINGLTFPNLRSLTVAMPWTSQDGLKGFLAKHPTLEEIDVAVESGFSTSLFDGIKARSANLRKLHLKAKKFINSVGRQKSVDWSFLGNMTRLKDFKLGRPFCKNPNWVKYGNGAHLLQSLPKNQLERLSLKGLGGTECGFWKFPDAMGRYVDDIDLTSKVELSEGFRNLNRLNLRRCPDSVDDKIMQLIVREMTLLQELKLSHCSRLTDTGLAGESEDGSNSIQNLKCLKKLSIGQCPLVTPDGLLSSLRLQFLRHFEYVASVNVTKDFVLKIMSQNPSLESLAVNFDCEESEILAEINNNSRLTKLTKLHEASGDFDVDYSSDEESGSDESDDADDFDDEEDDDDISEDSESD